MPRISEFYGIVIEMYFADHAPPHFHARYSGEEATIVMRYVERGTLSGDPFLGIEPAGQRYAKPGTTVYRVEGGRLARSWGVEDTLGWFRQLGRDQ